jgi:hypothetical protein
VFAERNTFETFARCINRIQQAFVLDVSEINDIKPASGKFVGPDNFALAFMVAVANSLCLEEDWPAWQAKTSVASASRALPLTLRSTWAHKFRRGRCGPGRPNLGTAAREVQGHSASCVFARFSLTECAQLVQSLECSKNMTPTRSRRPDCNPAIYFGDTFLER